MTPPAAWREWWQSWRRSELSHSAGATEAERISKRSNTRKRLERSDRLFVLNQAEPDVRGEAAASGAETCFGRPKHSSGLERSDIKRRCLPKFNAFIS